jgi:hypothetical protein
MKTCIISLCMRYVTMVKSIVTMWITANMRYSCANKLLPFEFHGALALSFTKKSNHLIKRLNLYEHIRYIIWKYTVKFRLLFKCLLIFCWCTDDTKAEFLMQKEIVFPISSQWGCRFMAYNTQFGCLDTKIRMGVNIKHIWLTKCSYFFFYEIDLM